MDIPIYLELEEDDNMSGFKYNTKMASDPLLPLNLRTGKLKILS